MNIHIYVYIYIYIYICIHTHTHIHTRICIYTAVMRRQGTLRENGTRFPDNSGPQQNLLTSVNYFHVPPTTCKFLQIQHMFTPIISSH